MINIFLVKLILTFLVGSIWITLATVLAERFGTKIGGIVGGLPSTIVVALFFIAWTQSPNIVVQSTTIIPIVMGINTLFVVVFILLARKNFYLGLIGSLTLWIVLSLLSVYLKPNFQISLIGFLLLSVVSYYVLEIKTEIKSLAKKKIKYTLSALSLRALLSGAIITLAVFMAKIGGPLLGGIFAAFPAVFLSTAIITHLAHGNKFSEAVLKVLMVSGTLNVIVYLISVRYLIIPYGIICGTLAAYLISIIFASFLYISVIKKMA